MDSSRDSLIGYRNMKGNVAALKSQDNGLTVYVLRYYYQYDEARLPVCTLPVNGCLHVANDLRMSGPAWVHWTFYVERYCLFLKTGLRSRRNPWTGLSRVILFSSYLSQLSVKFDLSDELESFSMRCGQDV